MCCCGKPNVNGQMGYKWSHDAAPGIHQPRPPDLRDGDELLFDEPGRCGGTDSHNFHFRVVKGYGCDLLVRHGGGQERIRIAASHSIPAILAAMDSTARYWTLAAIYHAHADGKRLGQEQIATQWRQAAAEKRIKVRKVRGQVAVRVSIVDRLAMQGTR